MYQNSTVQLSVTLQGVHKTHGSYTYVNNANGDRLNTDKPPLSTECKKTIHLGNAFVTNALAEPPSSLKDRIRGNKWKRIGEQKRIALHVNSFVKALHPEHKGYSFEVL